MLINRLRDYQGATKLFVMGREKFTPGPWEVSVSNSGSIFGDMENAKHNGDNPYIGTVDGIDSDNKIPESQANARLIARAPDMYELLDLVLNQGQADRKSLRLIQNLLDEINNESEN